MEVITNIRNIGITTAKRELESATYLVILSLQVIGIIAVERKLDWTTIEAVNSLGDVGKAAKEHKLDNKAQDAESALNIFSQKVPEQNEYVHFWIKGSLKKVKEA